VIADRTACSILTLFIVIATSRPLNKKSVYCQSADATITARICVRNPQSAHLCLHLQSAQALVGRHCWQRADSQSESHIHSYGVSSAFL